MNRRKPPMITMPAWFDTAPHLIQWERLLRWRNRSEIAIKDDEFPLDVLLVLFMHILHMRDWLSASQPGLKQKIHSLFQNSEDLSLARDIANGAKHMVVNNYSIDGSASVAREYNPYGPQKISYVIPCSGGPHLDALALADRCIGQIRAFMEAHSCMDVS